MTIKNIILFPFFVLKPVPLSAATDDVPTINPTAVFTTDDGEEEADSYSGSAPLEAAFNANP